MVLSALSSVNSVSADNDLSAIYDLLELHDREFFSSYSVQFKEDFWRKGSIAVSGIPIFAGVMTGDGVQHAYLSERTPTSLEYTHIPVAVLDKEMDRWQVNENGQKVRRQITKRMIYLIFKMN